MKTNCLRQGMLALLLACGLPASQASMQEMADEVLAGITGQALFIADRIPGNLTGSDALSTPFTYYRLGVDGELLLNLNVDKAQLGCGGFNEGIAANACDVDIDYLALTGSTNSGGPTSAFVMDRPYLEIAIKNDGDKTKREVVGIKIGAAVSTGIMSIGRIYTNGQANLENGGVLCNPNYANNVDNGARLGCHSGANYMSGFMNAEMSGRGFLDSTVDSGVCLGWTRANTSDDCGAAQAEFVAIYGTRMSDIAARNMTLYLDNGILGIDSGKADVRESLRFLHEVAFTSSADPTRTSKDFWLSFQRERMRWPVYDYNSPYDTDGFLPIGTSKNGDTTLRSYHFPANTGWWMNIQYASVLDLNVGTITLSTSELVGALGEGANLYNFNSGLVAVDNCFGTLRWC